MPKLSVQSFHEGLGRELNQTSNLELANNGDRATKLLMNHEAKDAHHGSTAVVQLNGALRELGLLIKGVPAEVKSTVTEITRELSLASHILHDEELKEANEGNNLQKPARGDGTVATDGGPSISNGVKGGSRVINVTRKLHTSTGDDVAKEGKLRNTAVLDLDVTEAIEPLLVSIGEHTKGIEESKGGLGTELGIEGLEGSGGLS
mmetsp:Transcript_11609/g.24215  ORF Transcript_11609/g.24215 Transcript_11609/m.24215 type:complete len:205 (-) Transcript_11609:195-809(-)